MFFSFHHFNFHFSEEDSAATISSRTSRRIQLFTQVLQFVLASAAMAARGGRRGSLEEEETVGAGTKREAATTTVGEGGGGAIASKLLTFVGAHHFSFEY